MECSCGSSETLSRSATCKVTGAGRYLLEFHECKACGRVGGELLRVKGTNSDRILSAGLAARREYAVIEGGGAESPSLFGSDDDAVNKEVSAPVPAPTPDVANPTSKLDALLVAGNLDFTTWPKPDPAKAMLSDRGRHYLIWDTGEFKINILYFHYLYGDGSSLTYVPLLDLTSAAEGPEGSSQLMDAFSQIRAFLGDTLGLEGETCGITCAPPIKTPVHIRTVGENTMSFGTSNAELSENVKVVDTPAELQAQDCGLREYESSPEPESQMALF